MRIMEKDCMKIWSNCLLLIQDRVNPEIFRNLFQPIKALRLEKNVLTFQVPSYYVVEVLERDFIEILRMALKQVIGPKVKL